MNKKIVMLVLCFLFLFDLTNCSKPQSDKMSEKYQLPTIPKQELVNSKSDHSNCAEHCGMPEQSGMTGN